MDVRSRARILSLAVLAVVFASGIVVGFAWDRHLDAAEAEASRVAESGSDEGGNTGSASSSDTEGEAGAEAPRARRGRAMYDQVDPTEAQRVRIDSIVEAYRQEVRTFHRDSRNQYDEGMRAIVLQTREAIKGVLDPVQREMYDSLTAARDARNRDDDESGQDRD